MVTVQKFLPEELRSLEKVLMGVSSSGRETVLDRVDVVAFIDEAHRTQYGVLAEQMMRILRNANFFAFTGTPVPRNDWLRNTFAKFSPRGERYLDKYFILDSISDGYTVRIAYQPGPFNYKLDRGLLEEFLDSEFDELPEEIRVRVEERVGRELDIKRFKVFLEDPGRIDRIAEYIAGHFRENVDGKFKAMVVAASRKACVLYKRALDKYLPSDYSEVVMTFQAQERSGVIEEYKRELLERYKVNDPKLAVEKIVERFRSSSDPRILIVTDMLLTGFDAPILQTMYLDKPLKGHRLLQAIARVNRPYKGVKEYGLVVDFIGIFDELEKAFAMYEKEDLKGVVYDVEDILRRFRETLKELIDLMGSRPRVKSQEELFRCVRLKVEEIARDKRVEEEFLKKYRVLRKIYEIISPKLELEERDEYKWLSDIYVFYTRSVSEETPEDQLARRYFKKTVEAISQSLQVIEKEGEFNPFMIDKRFFEEFIKRKDISVEEKASTLILHTVKARRYVRNDPVYISVADKIESLLESWRKKLKTSEELYEEAKRLWEEIYELRSEKAALKFGGTEFLVYRTLMDRGFSKKDAIKITHKLIKMIHDKISVTGWKFNPKLKHDVERMVAITILREARKANLETTEAKKLIELIVKRLENVEQSEQ